MTRTIGVMIGGPGDVSAEVDAVKKAIASWSAHDGRRTGIRLEAVHWETHATPGLRGRPQGMINAELIPQAEALIAIFRCRAGTPTGAADSGTIEEIEEFLQQSKYVGVYFYEGEVPINAVDLNQLQIVRDLEQKYRKSGLVSRYKSVDNLEAQVARHLGGIVSFVESAVSVVSDLAKPSDKRAGKKKARAKSTPTKAGAAKVVDDSGKWTMIGTAFYEAEKVERKGDDSWLVTIHSTGAEDDALLSSLKPDRYGHAKPVPFAHRNDACMAKVGEIESVYEDGVMVWKVPLLPDKNDHGGPFSESSYGTEGKTYSSADFARMRAGRILINDPPPVGDNHRSPLDQVRGAMFEHYIRGSNTTVTVDRCVVQTVHKSFRSKPEQFLPIARLASVYFLKLSNVCEQIFELKLGPIKNGKVHIRFRGRRHKTYSNVDADVVEVEGDCQLTE